MKSLMTEGETATVEEKFLRIAPDDIKMIADLISDGVNKALNRQDQLLNLKELSEAMGVSYHTLKKKSLPHCRLDRKGEKRYKLREVMAYLDKPKR